MGMEAAAPREAPAASGASGAVESARGGDIAALFSLTGKVAVVTGGYGTLGRTMAHGLARAGADVGIMGRDAGKCEEVAVGLRAEGLKAFALPADCTDRASLEAAAEALRTASRRCDILVNGAGGNKPAATVRPDQSFADMDPAAFSECVDLNLMGTVLPSQVFSKSMLEHGSGTIINISSVSGEKALTRVGAYSAAKAAVDNFTQWLAVELATKASGKLRVNAIAPGFMLADQNRDLLTKADGSLTSRGEQIISQTPFRRFGDPEELVGPLIWLASDAAAFVTGQTIYVDGGFTAYSGV
mmetsp:Transcript_15324/g.43470  ORF Transcript_15324/g.43470 Transcript_15324/m.43470 type:complete len:300 (-) Transcript_15324:118-1017(-)